MSNDEGLRIPVDMPGAGPALAALLRIADAVEKTGQKSADAAPKAETLGEKFKKIGDAARNINETRSALLSLAGDVGRAVVEFNDLAIAGDRQRIALDSLGDGYQMVQAATRGTVTAAEAYRTQQTLAQAHIRTTDAALATITRTARDHARALGIETPEALQQLTDALREGEQGGLRRFGIAVTAGATQADTYASAIRQMEAAQRAAAPAALTMAESTAQLGTSVDRVTSGLALWLSQGAGLDGMIARLSRGVRGLADDVELLNSRAASPEGRADAAARSAALAEYTRERAALRAALESSGGDTSALSDNRDVGELNAAQLRGRASRMRELLRPGDTGGGVLIGGVDPLASNQPALSPAALSAAARQLRTDIDNERAEAARAARPGPAYGDAEQIAQAARDKGLLNDEMQRRAAAGAAAASAAHARALAEMAEEIQEKQRLNAELLRAIDLEQRHASDQMAFDAAEKGRLQDAADLAAGTVDQFRDGNKEGKEAGAEAAARERSASIRGYFEDQASAAVNMRSTVVSAYEAMTGAAGDHFAALVNGSESAGQALQGFVYDSLTSLAKIAAQQAVFELGKGLAALFVNPPAAGAHFAAAAAFGVAAAAAGGLSQAVGSPGASARGGGSAAPQRAADVAPRRSEGASGAGVVIVEHNYAPRFGGRDGGMPEVGSRISRYTSAEARRTSRESEAA